MGRGWEVNAGGRQVTSNLGQSVPVAVMQVAIPWIPDRMKNYHPLDERHEEARVHN
jgi:hypothetical protein